jgi:hypothetical protein
MASETIKNVHTEHCCAIHGCKYKDNDCPVVNRVLKQSFLCEDCDADIRDGVPPIALEEALKPVQGPLIMSCSLCRKYKRTKQMAAFQHVLGEKIAYDSSPVGHEFIPGLFWICHTCIETIKVV